MKAHYHCGFERQKGLSTNYLYRQLDPFVFKLMMYSREARFNDVMLRLKQLVLLHEVQLEEVSKVFFTAVGFFSESSSQLLIHDFEREPETQTRKNYDFVLGLCLKEEIFIFIDTHTELKKF